jgi:hypothetical protein
VIRACAGAGALIVCFGVHTPAFGQTFAHRGFVQGLLSAYPQTTERDDTRVLFDTLARWEPGVKKGAWRFDAAFEGRMDTHDLTRHSADVSYWDRSIQRPALSVARLSGSWARGPLTIEAGKQPVRWGKTDILVPTDRFAPRDYLTVVDAELLNVTAARMTAASASNSLEVVITPRMTPSRAPLLDQRWLAIPPVAAGFSIVDAGSDVPEGTQYGVRWNRVGARLEHSLSFFRGFDHLPTFGATPSGMPAQIAITRHHAQLTSAGADVAMPLRWLTLKAEAAWLDSSTPGAADFVLYVVQAERQRGEWLFIGGYAGEYVVHNGTPFRYDADRGLARAFIGRASLTIDTNRSLFFEAVARQDGDGLYGRVEYTQALHGNWRATATGVGFAGEADDFLGRQRRNSFVRIMLRYSF